MRKRGSSQLSLDLPVPPTSHVRAVEKMPVEEGARSPAPVYSLVERKAAKEKSEIARHFSDILQLVHHFR